MTMQTKLAAALILFLALIGTHWHAYKKGGRNETAKLKLQYSEALVTAQAAARDKERAYQTQLKEAQDDFIRRQNRLLADAASARAESVRLRDTLADIRRKLPGLTESAVREYADIASIVFDECQGKYIELAEQADRLDNDRQTLIDAWPK